MYYLSIVAQLFLSLSILIVLHELGHFIPARLFGTRVEKFYLFFDPWFELFKIKKGDTEYGIGWLPLGGYVKIAGMIDESMDLEQLKQPPQPWEFRSKKAWQRLIIMLGGVTVNFILGFFIWGMVVWTWGDKYLPTDNATYGIYADSLGMELGLQNGDLVRKIDDIELKEVNDGLVFKEIIFNNPKQLVVDRNNETVNLPIPEGFSQKLTARENKGRRLYGIPIPFVANKFSKDSPAEKAGLKLKDKIVAINGQRTPFFSDFARAIRGLKGQEVNITVERDGQEMLLPITTTADGKIGVYPNGNLEDFYTVATQEYDFFPALGQGWSRGTGFLGGQIKAFGKMFKNEIKFTESVGGFGSIASLFDPSWDWQIFWRMTAVLSLILAFMNLLPIPALDGGHVMFLLYEMVTGRKPSDKFLEYSTIAGFLFVILLVVMANYQDLVNADWFKKIFN